MTRHKYSAIATEIDGHRFPSRAEARRYSELRMLEKAGEIEGLELQPKFPLIVNGEKVGTYIADFRYRMGKSKTIEVIEDVKGVATPVFKLKQKMVRAQYGIEIAVTR